MEELLRKIEEEYKNFHQEATLQVAKGNKAAGARSRKSAMGLRVMLKEWRGVSVESGEK